MTLVCLLAKNLYDTRPLPRRLAIDICVDPPYSEQTHTAIASTLLALQSEVRITATFPYDVHGRLNRFIQAIQTTGYGVCLFFSSFFPSTFIIELQIIHPGAPMRHPLGFRVDFESAKKPPSLHLFRKLAWNAPPYPTASCPQPSCHRPRSSP